MSKNWIVAGIIIVALVVIGSVIWGFSDTAQTPLSPDSQQPTTIQGTITNVAASARVLTVEQEEHIYPVAIDRNTRVFNESGGEADFSYLKKGFDVSVEGTWTTSNSLLASVIRVTKAPAIIIYTPTDQQVVSDAVITVSGVARVFENSFMIRVRTSTTTTLFEEPVMNETGGMGEFGEFNYTFTLSKNTLPSERVFIDAFEYSARDGSQINTATVTIYVTHRQTTNVKVFFNNDRYDPQVTCSAVFEVQRVIPYTQSVGTAAIGELLLGPIDKEPGLDYYTNIPTGTKLNSLRIEQGTAYADFSKELEPGGGSCRIAAIRAQIDRTLKQFPTVRNVVISINGNVDDILQP
ncbi:hypothetical protein A2755_02000 [Candidatus Wolfebacteria bacterium RIFCSPHIGHO2_01_FULL_48_22]|uniref:GerMN domain-containing protein n=2 Tax=Candidatus Wolfeibacteriota TaxID=1752735 RepID=A0A1F8DQP9_9BACT|nr:MAG: hypothetical protein A2755_02000 [Candidatus Wolfebacteria bacterium RIFCSPHIGHO2_01_FULL_48_22]OGM92002.1 MAG: hypothetical protein A2935_02640 [Candidatus Wolfebacteria bacterium RIFCSPLOWO2_01_FULL_47_17b]